MGLVDWDALEALFPAVAHQFAINTVHQERVLRAAVQTAKFLTADCADYTDLDSNQKSTDSGHLRNPLNPQKQPISCIVTGLR
jgi:hypothetical protein